MRRRWTCLAALWLAMAVALVAAAPGRAATYPVTTTMDTVPGQQPCTLVQCSLRAAVETASSTTGEADLIQVPAGTYTLTQGALAIPSGQTKITLAGAGAGLTIISVPASSAWRVLTVGTLAQITVTGTTLRGGFASDGQPGGNILVDSQASLSLDHVRVTNGVAGRGAGIAAQGAQRVEIANSLIDHNLALAFPSDGGGGLFVDGATAGNTELQIRDSTMASNAAVLEGGGIAIRNNAKAKMLLQGVTIASNQTGATLGGGLAVIAPVGGPAPQVHVGGSILAGNIGAAGPSNCSGALPTNDGGNVESGTDCGLGLAGRQNTDPQLSADLIDAGGQTPVLSLAATSPAIDVAPCTTATDQRDVARPQGAGCDAGAYEHVFPTVTPPGSDPQPLPQPKPLAPVANKTVVVTETSGRVLVKLPGTKRFVALTTVRNIPLGTIVDATKGRVRVTSAANAKGATQTAVFYGGIFKIGQSGPDNRLVTVLTLVGAKPSCKKPKQRAGSSAKRKSRRLWGDGKGRFQTKGQYSSATVRGTKWLVEDSCKGTLTRVARGVVSVRDFVKRKSVTVKAGRSYLAKPRR